MAPYRDRPRTRSRSTSKSRSTSRKQKNGFMWSCRKGRRLRKIYKDGDKQIKQQQMLVCRLCLSCEVNEPEFGEFLTNGDITIHYFCMLLASGLYQNGRISDKRSIKGFQKQDILREIKRGFRLRCYYCRERGATIGCCMSGCKKNFHLSCGRASGALHQFFDTYSSLCEEHRPEQRTSINNQRPFRGTCAICLSAVDARSSRNTICSPCCNNSWFHRTCMQNYAVSAGKYFFRCPVCSCVRTFQNEMLNFGIYIPDQDASWERQPNAYNELLERYSTCDAPECICPQGRKYDAEKGKFDLILCEFCGSFGTHRACHGLIQDGTYLLCPFCSDNNDSVVARPKNETLSTDEEKESACDLSLREGRVLRSQLRCTRSQKISLTRVT